MARKKTPPEYGESDYREVSIAIRSSLISYRNVVDCLFCTEAGMTQRVRADLQGP
jgi:hypothetical protein